MKQRVWKETETREVLWTVDLDIDYWSEGSNDLDSLEEVPVIYIRANHYGVLSEKDLKDMLKTLKEKQTELVNTVKEEI